MGMDPFTLQCLFRIQGEKIGPCSATPGIQSVLEPGRHVDFGVLRWCWPPDFDQFSVLIIESTCNGPHSFKLFESNGATEERKLVILLHNKKNELYQLPFFALSVMSVLLPFSAWSMLSVCCEGNNQNTTTTRTPQPLERNSLLPYVHS